MKKRIGTLILALCMLLLLNSATVFAAGESKSVIVSGTEVALIVDLEETGGGGETLTGWMGFLATERDAMLLSYNGNLTTVDIPATVDVDGKLVPVTKIQSNAFANKAGLVKVTVPESVVSMGYQVFSGCADLEEVIMFNDQCQMDTNTFSSCTSLERVRLPEGLTMIPDGTFIGCTNLKEVNIPKGVTSIGSISFANCESLTNVKLPDGLTEIGESAFNNAGITEITIPAGMTAISDDTFNSCDNLASITIPGNVKTIGNAAFAGCEAVTSIIMEEGVTYIDKSAFSYCWRTHHISVPSTVTTIGNRAFQWMPNLETVHFYGDFPILLGIDGVPTADNQLFYTDPLPDPATRAYFPKNNKTWTGDVMLQYGGNLLWIAEEQEVEIIPVTDVTLNKFAMTLEVGDSETLTATVAPANATDKTVSWKSDNTSVATVANGQITAVKAGTANITVTAKDGNKAATCKVTVVRPSLKFVDVAEDAYYRDAVDWAVKNGITTGTGETTFSPVKICLRAEVVTFLWRENGCPEPKTTRNVFTDVKPGDYFYKAVLWATENGITKGTTQTTFSPYEQCTRGQVVTFLWREKGCPEPNVSRSVFTDVNTIHYFYKAVLWATEQGITNGTTQTTFSPENSCERGAIVTFLYRAR